jgi:hypothetical protein
MLCFVPKDQRFYLLIEITVSAFNYQQHQSKGKNGIGIDLAVVWFTMKQEGQHMNVTINCIPIIWSFQAGLLLYFTNPSSKLAIRYCSERTFMIKYMNKYLRQGV